MKTVDKHAMFKIALDRAYVAANEAQAGLTENMKALNCGFAWVIVHDRAFMRWCRENAKRCNDKAQEFSEGSAARAVWSTSANSYGDKHHAAGWCFWKPGSFKGQDVDIHYKGAKAFADSLAHSLQIRCETGTRLD